MKPLVKPYALKKNDLVATVSLSSGTAGLLRDRYEQGKRQFEDSFGVKIVEMQNTLKSPDELYNDPQLRLADLMEAFQTPDIKAILTNIGGDDTIRLLRHMTDRHFDIIRNNPKVFLGMSDTTANHFMLFKAGLGSFYSPSLMFGYAENCGIPEYLVENAKRTLFNAEEPAGILPEAKEFIADRVGGWSAEANKIRRPRLPATPWRYIQGEGKVQGRLLGGCAEVLNMINGTLLWPKLDDWENAIMFLETSEEMPPPSYVLYLLRNFGAQGILERINGILFARPGGEFSPGQEAARDEWIANYPKFDEAVLKACREYGRTDMPVVTNMNFGHTVPQAILPIGTKVEIDPAMRTVSIVESAVR